MKRHIHAQKPVGVFRDGWTWYTSAIGCLIASSISPGGHLVLADVVGIVHGSKTLGTLIEVVPHVRRIARIPHRHGLDEDIGL
ncbi:MAG: hypothetical protein JXM70_14605 [Pirellulales bacterium]|nr:hypothetical protein [Pirellulales bacterium]